MGTATAPFLNDATITLHGDRYSSIELPMVGSKCLAVMDYPYGANANMNTVTLPSNFRPGVLDIHGAPRLRSWTKLDVTANFGDTVIVMSEDIDWGVGDHLVVTSSEQDMNQNEEVVVAAVLGPRTLRLSAPLKYTHRSSIYRFENRRVDLRPEVPCCIVLCSSCARWFVGSARASETVSRWGIMCAHCLTRLLLRCWCCAVAARLAC